MADIAAPRQDERRRTFAERLRHAANPATVKGAIALMAGVALVVLPDLTLTLVELILGVTLLAIGAYDVTFAVVGRRLRPSEGSRWQALVRGLASIGVGLLMLIAPRDTLTVIIIIAGMYLLIRGAVSLVGAVFTTDRRTRRIRLTSGAGAVAFGVLALVVPDSLTEGLLLSGAIIAVLLGAVLLYYGLRVGVDTVGPDVTTASTVELVWYWVSSNDIGDARRSSLADNLYFEEPDRLPKLAAWWTMLLLSVAIATFAVLQDSTAVVIGAMLIAPLMTPILGLAGAAVNGWGRRLWASTSLVALGATAAVVVAYLISSWVPEFVSFDANSQISSRVNPTFVDMLIAVAAGAAGAFATVNARVASSIAGVAIAVALVPPLAVVGVALQTGRFDEAFGALLLFMTNFVSIVLTAAVVFVITGFADTSLLRRRQRAVLSTLTPFASLALVILVPLIFTGEGILATATAQQKSQQVVDDWLGDDSQLRVQEVTVDELGLESASIGVVLSGASRVPSTTDLQELLADELGQPVDVTVEVFPSATITVDKRGSRVQRGDVDVSER
jgi:uncharacterized hydrophobic protein (TIGR00271 family)